jgi:hypothetical protein
VLETGTLLDAGTDAEGQALRYRTVGDLVVNQGRVMDRRSLYVDRQRIGFDEVRRRPEVLAEVLPRPDGWLHLPENHKRFVALLEMACGSARPFLPDYPRPARRNGSLTQNLLAELDAALEFIVGELFLPRRCFVR